MVFPDDWNSKRTWEGLPCCRKPMLSLGDSKEFAFVVAILAFCKRESIYSFISQSNCIDIIMKAAQHISERILL